MLLFFILLFFVTIIRSTQIIELIRFPTGQFNGTVVTSSSHIEFTVILHTHLLSIDLPDIQCHLNCLHHHVLQICTTTDYSQDCRNVTKSVYSYTLSFSRDRELDQTLSFQILLRTEQGTSMIEGVSHLLVEERNIAWRLVDHSLPTVHQFVSIVEQQQQPSLSSSSSSPLTGWIIGSMTGYHRDLFLSLSLKDMRMIVTNDMKLSLCETSIGVHVTCCSLSSSRNLSNTMDGHGNGSGAGEDVIPHTTRQFDSCLPPSADIGILLLDQNTTTTTTATTTPILPHYRDLVHAAVNTVRGTIYVFTTTMQSLSDTLMQLPMSLRHRCSFVTLLDKSKSDHSDRHHYHNNQDGNNNSNNNNADDNKDKEETTTPRGSDSTNTKMFYSCTQSRVSHASMYASDIVSMQGSDDHENVLVFNFFQELIAGKMARKVNQMMINNSLDINLDINYDIRDIKLDMKYHHDWNDNEVNNQSQCNTSVNAVDEKKGTSGNVVDGNTTRADTETRASTSRKTRASTVDFSFRYGINLAVLEDVCMINNTAIVVYSHYDNDDSGDDHEQHNDHNNYHNHNHDTITTKISSTTHPTLLPTTLRTTLKQSYSGFHTHHPEHAGWRFLEKSVRDMPNRDYHNSNNNDDKHVLWMEGTTIAASPPFVPSIFHAAQVLLGLVHLSHAAATHDTSSDANTDADAESRTRPYPWILNMKRLLLPTIPKGDLPWTIGLTSLVTAFVHHQIQGLAPGPGLGPGPELAQESDLSYPQVFLKEDVEQIFTALQDHDTDDRHQNHNHDNNHSYNNSNNSSSNHYDSNHHDNNSNHNHHHHPTSLICYDQLVILGTLDLSLPFVTTTHEALAFRTFAYSFLQLTDTIGSSHGGIGDGNGDGKGGSGDQRGGVERGIDGGLGTRKVDPFLPTFHPNDMIRVTIILRPDTRKILNMPALVDMLNHTGIVDMVWLHVHGLRPLEGMSFREQVSLMRATDVLITPHGAALTNLIFLQTHSAVIELFTSPWYEPGYQATALLFSLHYQAIASPDLNQSSNCEFLSECMDTPLLIHRRELACYGIRQCDVHVDVRAVEVAFWQAAQAIRIVKRDIHAWRLKAMKDDPPLFYNKTYTRSNNL